jgi:hypothetical protein
MPHYELIDRKFNRLIETSATLEDALAMVRLLLTTGYPGYVVDLALAFVDEPNQKHIVAEGPALTARALAGTTISDANDHR